MSTTGNDTPPRPVPPGRRPSTRATKSRPTGRGAPPDPTGPINRSPATAASAGTIEDQVPQDLVPPDGFTTVADGTRQRGSRHPATINRVMVVPRGDSDSTTLPTDENRLLPVEEFFNDDDTTPEDDDAPPQPEDKFEALMRAITDIKTCLDETDTRLGNRLDDITTKLEEFDDIKRDTKNRLDKLDQTIDTAIINKIDDVVNEVTDRVFPIIAKQVTTQVTTAIDSHVAELRQKHTNMHNMDNSISTYKQQIDGELSALRDSNKSINALLRDMIDDKNGNKDITHDDDKDDDSNIQNNDDDDTNEDDTDANNNEGVDSR